jgi:acetolactate synthase-1/2/3 large subunit
MSLAAVKIRATSAPKTSTTLTFTRSRSTAAANPSFLEARARVKEYARNISRSSAHNALVTPVVYVLFSSVLLIYS